MVNHKMLIMRSNRSLGAALVENGLIQMADQEAANGRLLELLQSDDLMRANILNVLIYEQNSLKEEDLIRFLRKKKGMGLVDLGNYRIEDTFDWTHDLQLCRLTWTLPFDCVEGIYFLATAWALAAPVVQYWEDFLDGPVQWYATSMQSMLDSLETLTNVETDKKS